MSPVTQFGVLPILRGLEGKYSPLRVMDACSADEAKRKADVFATVVGGAVAFSISGDPNREEWDETVILGCFGEVPGGFKGLVVAEKVGAAISPRGEGPSPRPPS